MNMVPGTGTHHKNLSRVGAPLKSMTYRVSTLPHNALGKHRGNNCQLVWPYDQQDKVVFAALFKGSIRSLY